VKALSKRSNQRRKKSPTIKMEANHNPGEEKGRKKKYGRTNEERGIADSRRKKRIIGGE